MWRSTSTGTGLKVVKSAVQMLGVFSTSLPESRRSRKRHLSQLRNAVRETCSDGFALLVVKIGVLEILVTEGEIFFRGDCTMAHPASLAPLPGVSTMLPQSERGSSPPIIRPVVSSERKRV